MKKKTLFYQILTSTSLVVLSVPAMAQDKGAENAEEGGGDIIVTGSRVIKNGDSSPTPLTVVTTKALGQTTPSSLTEGLSKQPIFTNSGARFAPTLARNNNNGSYVNLRGMGEARTLVLLDGQRLNGTTQDGIVDTGTIPQMLIERVDVATGGVSAVYGSDAVTGVVNFVIDHNFKGLKAQAQAGISSRGDLGSQRLGAAFGTDVGDRGHFIASVEYYNAKGLPSNRYARENGAGVYTYTGNGTKANPFVLTRDSRTSWSSAGGTATLIVPITGTTAYQFLPGGNIVAQNMGAATGTSTTRVGGDGGVIDRGFASDSQTLQSFARFQYELSDNVTAYVQGMASEAKSFGKYLPGGSAFLWVNKSNPFISDAARATLNAVDVFPAGAFLFGKHDPTLSDSLSSIIDSKVTNYRIMAGLEGKLGESFDWKIGYGHGYTRQQVINVNNVNNGKYFAATDAVRDSNNNIVCRVTLTNPGLYPGCVPINLFGVGSVTPAMIDYIADTTSFRLTNTMDDFTVSLSGSPFNSWAGPVTFALSGEYRQVTLKNVSSNQPGLLDCTGLSPLNCDGKQLTYVTDVLGDVDVSQKVKEAAVEVNLPLLADSAVGSANLLGAFRYTDYNTSGNVETWKLGLNWKLSDDLTLRATRSRDIRAPSLNDLFRPATFAPGTFNDLHTNTTNITNNVSRGNPTLKPEIAQTLTLGLVYKPSWLPRFSIAVDYFDIKLSNAIALISGNDAAVQRNCEDSNGTSPLCALYVRPLPFSDRTAANRPSEVRSIGLNVAQIRTKGVDFEMNYSADTLGGTLALRGLLTYQPTLETLQFAGDAVINGAGAAQGAVGTSNVAKWRATGLINYTNGGFSLGIQTRWRSSLRVHADTRLVFADTSRVPAVSFTDINLSYSIESSMGTIEPFLTIENVFDKTPPLVGQVGSFPGLGAYSYVGDNLAGRYFTFGVRAKF